MAWLIASHAVVVAQAEETAALGKAQPIIEKALTAADPATALDGDVGKLSKRQWLCVRTPPIATRSTGPSAVMAGL